MRLDWLEDFKALALKLVDKTAKVTITYPACEYGEVNILCRIVDREQKAAVEEMVALLNKHNKQ